MPGSFYLLSLPYKSVINKKLRFYPIVFQKHYNRNKQLT